MNVRIEICMVGHNLKPKTRNCLNKKFKRGHTVLHRFFRLGISKQFNSIFWHKQPAFKMNKVYLMHFKTVYTLLLKK